MTQPYRALLVAPIFTPDGMVDYYLPHGRWTNFLSGQIVEGGRWVREQHGYLSLPLMARSNSVIAIGANEQRPDYTYADRVTLHVFELQDNTRLVAHVPANTGAETIAVEVSREGSTLRIQSQGATQPWQVLLRGVEAIQSVAGGNAQPDVLGTLLSAEPGAHSMTFRLAR